jgi:hypothetical protein
MKSFKCGVIEVMDHDYYKSPRQRGGIHINWSDYIHAGWDPFLRSLKEDGWRAPNHYEIRYLYELHRMGVGDFTHNLPPYSYYIVEPYRRTTWNDKCSFFDFHNGRLSQDVNDKSLGHLRLVRDL